MEVNIRIGKTALQIVNGTRHRKNKGNKIVDIAWTILGFEYPTTSY